MYRCNSILSTSIVVICFTTLASIGCNREPSVSAEVKSDRPDPAESFAEIVEIFTDGMDAPGGEASAFVASGANVSTRFQVHNTVTSELTAPANADDPYRGTITVSSQSIYSLRRVPGDDDDKKANDDQHPNSRNGFGLLDDEGNSDSGFQSFDQGLVAPGERDKDDAGGVESVQRRPDKVDRNYDLVYQAGRWELVTKLDPKTERSVANAFERALRLQP
jgi:hypothetical protein